MHTANQSCPPFIVFTPKRWSGSAGIYALHSLGNNLLKIGCDVYFYFYDLVDHAPTTHQNEELYFYEEHAENRKSWKKASGRLPLVDESIVIYPEVIPDNPLGAKRVVRYVMNYPEKNMHPMRPGENDFFLAYWREYYPSKYHFELPILSISSELFDNKDGIPFNQRSIDATYIGKGVKLPGSFFLPGTIPIHRDIPSTKRELFSLLSKTRLFYSWDPLSAILFEALFCGAVPVIIRTQPYFDALPVFSKLGPAPFARVKSQTDGGFSLDFNSNDFEADREKYIRSSLNCLAEEHDAVSKFLNLCLMHFSEITT